MAIARRLSNLLSADVHAVLDLMEAPQTLLKQAIRDMEEEIQSQQQALAVLRNQREKSLALQQRQELDLQRVNTDLDLCFDGDNQDLVRSLIRKKLQLERRIGLYEQGVRDAETDISDLQAQLESNQSRFEAMRERARTLLQQEPSVTPYPGEDPSFEVSEDEIEIAWLKERRQRSES